MTHTSNTSSATIKMAPKKLSQKERLRRQREATASLVVGECIPKSVDALKREAEAKGEAYSGAEKKEREERPRGPTLAELFESGSRGSVFGTGQAEQGQQPWRPSSGVAGRDVFGSSQQQQPAAAPSSSGGTLGRNVFGTGQAAAAPPQRTSSFGMSGWRDAPKAEAPKAAVWKPSSQRNDSAGSANWRS